MFARHCSMQADMSLELAGLRMTSMTWLSRSWSALRMVSRRRSRRTRQLSDFSLRPLADSLRRWSRPSLKTQGAPLASQLVHGYEPEHCGMDKKSKTSTDGTNTERVQCRRDEDLLPFVWPFGRRRKQLRPSWVASHRKYLWNVRKRICEALRAVDLGIHLPSWQRGRWRTAEAVTCLVERPADGHRGGKVPWEVCRRRQDLQLPDGPSASRWVEDGERGKRGRGRMRVKDCAEMMQGRGGGRIPAEEESGVPEFQDWVRKPAR